jgi:hypothetical protein
VRARRAAPPGAAAAQRRVAAPAIRELERAKASGVYDGTWGRVYDGSDVALIPGLIVVWVVTCIWLGLVRRNAESITPDYAHQRRFGWLWAGWIVPVVNF